MKTKQLEFDLSQIADANAFANTCRSLNQAGVPYHTKNNGLIVTIFIGDGY